MRYYKIKCEVTKMANIVRESSFRKSQLEGIVEKSGLAKFAQGAKMALIGAGLQYQTKVLAVAYKCQTYAPLPPQLTSLCAAIIGSYAPFQ